MENLVDEYGDGEVMLMSHVTSHEISESLFLTTMKFNIDNLPVITVLGINDQH